ncbi:hypothetical protein J6590_011933 [Homalodisca vitripennis]|nr:hypothetical protein J6590_011933 [Homalodisca vitripennis]
MVSGETPIKDEGMLPADPPEDGDSGPTPSRHNRLLHVAGFFHISSVRLSIIVVSEGLPLTLANPGGPTQQGSLLAGLYLPVEPTIGHSKNRSERQIANRKCRDSGVQGQFDRSSLLREMTVGVGGVCSLTSEVLASLNKSVPPPTYFDWREQVLNGQVLPHFTVPEVDQAIFQQDGALPHFANPVKRLLNDNLHGRWIGCGSEFLNR